MNGFLSKLALTFALAAIPAGALAADHQVRMLNKGPDGQPMQFEPAVLHIAPGDTVTFVAEDKGHNAELIVDIAPEGAERWKGKLNEEITVTFGREGVYGFKCQPHFGMGMVGLIQVGAAEPDLAATETAKLPGKAKPKIAELVGRLGAASGAASTN